MNADAFNAAYPVGTPVLAYPFIRPDDPIAVAYRERAAAGRLFKGADTDPCTRLITRTRSKAQVLGGHTDVVWVDGHSACVALDHVDVVSEDVWKAAKEAEATAAAVEDVPADTFPAWLARRFDPQGAPWDGMSDDDRSYWEHQAAAVRRAVARNGFKKAQPKSTQVVEYGVRVPGSAWPEDGVLLDGDTFDRADQEARLGHYRDSWPNAELVQRSVHRGEWTEAAS